VTKDQADAAVRESVRKINDRGALRIMIAAGALGRSYDVAALIGPIEAR
jgi:hypothetical protein